MASERSRSLPRLLGAAGVGILIQLALVPSVSAETPNAERPPQEQFNCLPLGADGKPRPQPNVAFICGQVDALRNDCEMQRLLTDVPVMNTFHCFDWRRGDVRPGVGGSSNPSARAQTTVGSGGR